MKTELKSENYFDIEILVQSSDHLDSEYCPLLRRIPLHPPRVRGELDLRDLEGQPPEVVSRLVMLYDISD